MGYYVHIEDSNCMLPHKHADLAYWRMCALNKNDDMKRGGSSNGDKWFSWMDPNYPETCKDAQAILVELGFDVEEQDDGLVIYAYDNKSGQEELFLGAISDLLRTVKDENSTQNKPFIVWRGEDDMVWKDLYGEREVRSLQGTIMFQENAIG
jgi:hypothetical protein|tara:strand:- start:2239 stop:2694 length:456 start_codon:yes stop_codon:yes gene_type:complete